MVTSCLSIGDLLFILGDVVKLIPRPIFRMKGFFDIKTQILYKTLKGEIYMASFNLERINELAKKAKEVGLTEEEKVEQERERRAYIDAFKNNLRATLDNVVIVDEDGNKKKPVKKN